MEAVAVVAQVVAVQERDRAGARRLARAQDRAHRAVDRLSRFAAPRAFDVRGQVGERQVQLVVLRIEVVARLGHGERDDARGRRRAARDHCGQRRLVRQHLADGLDLLVAVLARGRHGLQRVAAALRLQGRDDLGHVGPDVGARQRPAGVARLDQPLQVDGLVGAVERTQAQVEHRELRRSRWCVRGRRCCESHGKCPERKGGIKRRPNGLRG
jgi:hypothetical protein